MAIRDVWNLAIPMPLRGALSEEEFDYRMRVAKSVNEALAKLEERVEALEALVHELEGKVN